MMRSFLYDLLQCTVIALLIAAAFVWAAYLADLTPPPV